MAVTQSPKHGLEDKQNSPLWQGDYEWWQKGLPKTRDQKVKALSIDRLSMHDPDRRPRGAMREGKCSFRVYGKIRKRLESSLSAPD